MNKNSQLAQELQRSINQQYKKLERTITLSPTESFPLRRNIYPKNIERISNLYIFEQEKNKQSKRIFAGREQARLDIAKIYDEWSKLFGAKKVSMSLLSGLHSHTILALAFRNLAKRVLLLPEEAGGHTHTKHILQDLGYEVIDMPVDYVNFEIDFVKTKEIINSGEIDLVFVDRSEGLNYTDFSRLLKNSSVYSVFDSSHFLSNIMVGDYKNPFDMGFDLCIATLHKSYPGPQKAVVWTNKDDRYWEAVSKTIATYISSSHPAGIYAAGMVMGDLPFLRKYARLVMENSVALEKALDKLGIPVMKKNYDLPPSYYVFININNQDRAYQYYLDLAKAGIDTNYRYLPYNQGYGIRIGTTPVTMYGMRPGDANFLAEIMAEVYYHGVTKKARFGVENFLVRIHKQRIDK